MAQKRRAPARSRKSSPPPGGARFLPPDAPITLTVYLRHRRPVRRRPGSAIDLAELMRRVTPDELERERRRILKEPVEQIRRFAAREAMQVRDVDFRRRCVTLVAKASDAERAFATRLLRVDDGSAHHYPKRRPQLPWQLRPLVHTVLGLDTRPPRLERLRAHAGADGRNGLYPSAIARLYGIGTAGRGNGQCVAIIEPAGGYRDDDVDKASQAMGVVRPQIVPIAVGSGRNAPGVNAQSDAEVALDIQVVAGVAPQPRIAVYFTEFSEPGLVAGVCEAVHSTAQRPDVIVITWGEPETKWPAEARAGLDAVLQDAVRLGITVIATAGDHLAVERRNGPRVYVNYPASSPYVLACGGTQLTLDPTANTIVNEVVWNENGERGTGGGISELYRVPAFQSATKLPGSLNDGKPGRGVPDVAAAAAKINGYRIIVGGSEIVASGTSAVAPLWGAFIALINAERGAALGFVNSRLYQAPQLLKPITSGDNMDAVSGLGYEATDGWSACTGLGSPKGDAILVSWTAVA